MKCDETRIAEFVGGTLGPDEMKEVLDHLDKCPACEATFQDLAQIRALAPEIRPRLRPEFYQYDVPANPLRWLWRLAPAALLLGVLLGVGLVRGWFSPATAWQDLVETEAYPYEPSVDRGPAPAVAASREQVLKLYTAGDYERFLPLAQAWQRSHPDDALMGFLAGVAAYMRGRFEESVALLTANRKKPEGATPESAWYLANAHLRLDHLAEARVLLQTLSQQVSPYQERAARLSAALPTTTGH